MTADELADEGNGFAMPDAVCPLCSSETFSPSRQLRDNRTGAFEGTFTFARCDGCGLLSLRPQPDQRELAAGYVRGYGPYATDDVQVAVTPPRRARLRRAWHVLDGQATPDRFPLRGRVLDVGAGQGSNVAYLRARGVDAVGIEPNPRSVEVCQNRGLPVTYGDLETVELEEGSFDAVLLDQVVEHLLNPVGVLKLAVRALRPGGRLMVTTPNAGSLYARFFGDEWAHWHVPYHVYLYRKADLRLLFTSVGLAPERIEAVSPTFWLNMSVQARHHRSQQTGWVFPDRNFQPGLLLRLALIPPMRVLDFLGRGDCLIAVGRKS
jgi:SAM-dependent methyltransferase